jgi:hypothetical protein
LAAGHVFYELPGSDVGAWDRFSTRNIGLRSNQRMARDFVGDVDRMRKHSNDRMEKRLGVRTTSWTPLDKAAFENFALLLADEPRMREWTKEEKAGLIQVIRAKTNPDEMLYQKLTQSHSRLRQAFLRLGSPVR